MCRGLIPWALSLFPSPSLIPVAFCTSTILFRWVPTDAIIDVQSFPWREWCVIFYDFIPGSLGGAQARIPVPWEVGALCANQLLRLKSVSFGLNPGGLDGWLVSNGNLYAMGTPGVGPLWTGPSWQIVCLVWFRNECVRHFKRSILSKKPNPTSLFKSPQRDPNLAKRFDIYFVKQLYQTCVTFWYIFWHTCCDICWNTCWHNVWHTCKLIFRCKSSFTFWHINSHVCWHMFQPIFRYAFSDTVCHRF